MNDPLPSIPELKTNGRRPGSDDRARLTHLPLPGVAVKKIVVGAAGKGGWAKSFIAALAAKPVLTLSIGAMAAGGAVGVVQMARSTAASKGGAASDPFKARGDKRLAAPEHYAPTGRHRSSSLPYVARPNQGAFVPPPSASPAAASLEKTGDAGRHGEAGAAPAPLDPQALAAQLASGGVAAQGSNAAGAGGLKGLMARLGSGFGSLTGGGGLAGGVGRGFDAPRFSAPYQQQQPARTVPPAALPSPYGGQVQGFSKQKAPGRVKTAPIPIGASAYRSANLRRLDRMNSAMKPTQGMGNLQQASDIHTQQWSSAQDIGNAADAGGPAGAGPSGTTAGARDTSLQTPVDDSGPIGGGDAGQGSTAQEAPEVGDGQDVSPWSALVGFATAIVMLGALINIIAWSLRALNVIGPIGETIWGKLVDFVALLSGIVGVLGGIISMTYGQYAQGALMMIAGGAMLYAYSTPNYMPALMGAIVAFASSAIGSLLGKGHGRKIEG